MLIWDNHSCMSLRPDTGFLPQLDRYRRQKVDVVSLNVTFDLMSLASSFEVLSAMRRWVRDSHDYALVNTLDDVQMQRAQGRMSVIFDVEGLKGIGSQLDLLDTYHALGVRWASPVYNRGNQFGGGCLDSDDTGITLLGRDLVRRMNELGLVICASHTSRRTSLDLIEASSQPVIFSHSNAASVHRHPRNIDDEQIRACATSGGVVGINGIGIFMGRNDTSIESLVRHICHVADLVGVEHVGVSLDYAFDQKEVEGFFQNTRELFPVVEFGSTLEMIPPEVFGELPSVLAARGMTEREISLVLGGNWERVARTVWRRAA